MGNQKEIWKDIEGYDGVYQVSSFGRVRSFKRVNINILKTRPNTRGNLMLSLYENNVGKTFTVHKLVAQTFITKDFISIKHKDGNKENNSLENLEVEKTKDVINRAIKLKQKEIRLLKKKLQK